MKRNSYGQKFAIFFAVIVVIFIIGAIGEACEPKCIETGCDNKQAPESNYCYLHKPYIRKSSSYGDSSYSSGAKKPSTGKSSTQKSSSYDSYDDGYDDIYMDEDYDYDRYSNDSDYASGVDDAMEDCEEDW